MKIELQAKFLRYLIRKNGGNRGFNLIELLVVIVIVGMLSAISLPTLLKQTSKARAAEAQTYVAAINRGQQMYYLENNTFGNLNNLQLGISSSVNYTYVSVPSGSGLAAEAATTATPVGLMKGYAGKVWLGVLSATGNTTTLSIVCEGDPTVVPVIIGTLCP